MKIGIISGYFQCFHKGHLAYLKEALNWCDKLIVLVQDDEHQFKKYGIGFNPVFSIITNIQKAYNILENVPKMEIMVNHNNSVAEILKYIKQTHESDKLIFIKDGDRSWLSLPEDEKEVIEKNDIDFVYLGQPKIASSTAILKGDINEF